MSSRWQWRCNFGFIRHARRTHLWIRRTSRRRRKRTRRTYRAGNVAVEMFRIVAGGRRTAGAICRRVTTHARVRSSPYSGLRSWVQFKSFRWSWSWWQAPRGVCRRSSPWSPISWSHRRRLPRGLHRLRGAASGGIGSPSARPSPVGHRRLAAPDGHSVTTTCSRGRSRCPVVAGHLLTSGR